MDIGFSEELFWMVTCSSRGFIGESLQDRCRSKKSLRVTRGYGSVPHCVLGNTPVLSLRTSHNMMSIPLTFSQRYRPTSHLAHLPAA